MKKIVTIVPELFFIALGAYWVAENYFASGHINYIALLVTWLLFLQIFYKNRVAGLVYGIVLGLVSAYMMLAVLSEFHEYETATPDAVRLLVFGGLLFGLGFLMGCAMVFKFAKAKAGYMESELTATY